MSGARPRRTKSAPPAARCIRGLPDRPGANARTPRQPAQTHGRGPNLPARVDPFRPHSAAALTPPQAIVRKPSSVPVTASGDWAARFVAFLRRALLSRGAALSGLFLACCSHFSLIGPRGPAIATFSRRTDRTRGDSAGRDARLCKKVAPGGPHRPLGTSPATFLFSILDPRRKASVLILHRTGGL